MDDESMEAAAESGLQEITCWSDWAGDLDRAAILPDGRQLVQWALEVVQEFYGDEWFARHASRGDLPAMSLYDWPLSSPIAVVRLIERAARIAVASESVRLSLAEGTSGIRSSNDVGLFHHLDVVLEVAGAAARDGWAVDVEVAADDGRRPDLRVAKGSIAYTVEVTRQGHDRAFRAAGRQAHALTELRIAIEIEYDVDCSTTIHRQMDEDEFGELSETLRIAASATAGTGDVTEVDLEFAAAVVYPRDQRPNDAAISRGRELSHDLWPRFAQRLRTKAGQTASAGPSWIRIEEAGGLMSLTPAVHLPIDALLAILTRNIRDELESYQHVQGVVISHGAEPDWNPKRPTVSAHDPMTTAQAMERRLPGRRRRRTFIIPLNTFSGLTLPQQLVLRPDRWYDTEESWLDWALNRLGQPPASRLVPGELARRLVV